MRFAGNLITLRDEPHAKGINVVDALLDFHKKHYSTSIMKLVILGRESIETLEKWAVDMCMSYSALCSKHVLVGNVVNNGFQIHIPESHPFKGSFTGVQKRIFLNLNLI